MLRYFQAHPRDNVFGLRLNGNRASLSLDELDFTAPVRVLIYTGLWSTLPAAEATGLLISERAESVPSLLAQYLPTVNNLDEFLNP
jgi:hypothetical protein